MESMQQAQSTEIKRAQFTGLLDQSRTRLFGYIHTLVRNLSDADDVFQQTAMAMWRRFDSYDPLRSFLHWACGVARFEVATLRRSQTRDRLRFTDETELLLIDSFAQLPEADITERQAALPGCIGRLPEADRHLLEACYYREAEVAVVAQKLERSPQSVHNSLKRIRRVLFECVSKAIARVARE